MVRTVVALPTPKDFVIVAPLDAKKPVASDIIGMGHLV